MARTLSCCLWALSTPDAEAAAQVATAGFEGVDLRPFSFAEPAEREALRDTGLEVCCVAASHGQPEGTALDSGDSTALETAMAHAQRALAYAAELGVDTAYVVPEMDGSSQALTRYARALADVAERADSLGLKIGVEHFPGRSLPTVSGTLSFLADIGHPNLYLLFDLGHAQMSGEDPVEAIESAGSRLSYVHLDDNDGDGDLHQALLDGVLTEETLRRTLQALDDVGYDGPVSLELSPNLPDPLAALKRSREHVRRALGQV